MESNDPAARIETYIAKTFANGDVRKLHNSVSLLETGIIDSISVLELVWFLETEFEIAIDEDDLVADLFQSVRTLADYVERQMELKANSAAP